MADELKFNIGADVSDFQKGVTQVNTGLTSLQKASVNTGTTLTNLSRVASDAPFGFIAIQNNLEPLIQGFGSLSKQSGGTGAALKALAGSLAGPAGLAVGFSVVSALVTTAIQKYGSLGKAIDALFTSNDALILQEKQLADIRTAAATSAAKEITNIDVLSRASQDVTNSLTFRKDAADKLLLSYKEYLPKLTQEAILNGKAADAINAAKDAILQKALAAASEKKLAEITGKQLDNQLKTIDAVNAYGQAQKDVQNAYKKFNDNALKGSQLLNFEVETYTKKLNEAKSNLEAIGQENVDLQKQYDNLAKLTGGFAKAAGGAFVTGDEGKKEQERLKLAKQSAKLSQDAISEQNKLFNEALINEIKITEELAKQEAKTKKIADNYIKNIFDKKQLFVEGSKLNVEIPPIDTNKATEALNRAKESIDAAFVRGQKEIKLDQLVQQAQVAATVFGQVFNPIVDQFFTNIEEGQNVFKGFGDVIKQFVKNAIVQLVKLAAFAAITSIFSGGATSFGKAFTSGLGGAFGLPKLGGVKAGGMNVNVAGQFALRGSDLVASVGSAQQSINRVG